jgi:hypothetical protein
MHVADQLGNGGVAAAIAALLAVYGILARDRRLARAGVLTLLAIVLAGLLAQLLKLSFQLPRPHGLASYTFPSGHASTAFSVAGSLAYTFPVVAPALFFVASFASLARVYFRAHFVIDVAAGGVLGAMIGIAVARLLGSSRAAAGHAVTRVGWVFGGAVTIAFAGWFLVHERTLAAHVEATPAPFAGAPASVVVRFGTAGARPLLQEGWSVDEKWNGAFPFVWAEGSEASLALPPLPQADHRIRFRARPFSQGLGLSCEVVEVALNGTVAARALLERGWNTYAVNVPRTLVRPGANQLSFRFTHGGKRVVQSGSRDQRKLAVAFSVLEAASDAPGAASVFFGLTPD